jgi:lipopolysaccharide export system permease protein
MIFKRTLQSELIFYSSAVYAALLLVTLTFTLIRLLTQAVDGRIDPQSVFVLLGFAVVNYQAIVMSLSVFLGTLLVFSRMWRDSEMTIWQASGLSLRSFIWPTLRFAIPVALLAALFSMLVAPWANRQAYEFKDTFEKRDDLSRVATQQFKENRDGTRVFYVGNIDETTQAASNLFIVERFPKRPDVEGIVAAKTGGVVNDAEGDRFLELIQGRRYLLPTSVNADPVTSGVNKKTDISLMTYEQYRVMLSEKPATTADFVPYKQRSTLALLSDNEKIARGELLWRVGSPIMCILLAFLAVPLSYFNPRSGKSAPLVVSTLLYVVYMNAVSLSQNYLQSGKLKPLVALLSPHLCILLLAIVLLLWRSQWFMQIWGELRRKRNAQPADTAGVRHV